MAALSVITNDDLNGVTTFNFTLLEAILAEDGSNTCELQVINPNSATGTSSKFVEAGVTLRTDGVSYKVVAMNNRATLNWVVANNINSVKYFFFVHSIPEDKELLKEVLPPSPVALSKLLGGAVQVVAFSERSKEYLEGLGHTVTLVRNAINLTRFASGTSPASLNKVLVFDLRNNALYKEVVQNLASMIPNLYVRVIQSATWEMEEEIAKADLVIAYGRSAIESMAMGKAVIIYGENGGDGLVVSENKENLAKTNYSGWSVRSLPLPGEFYEFHLLNEIQRYDDTDNTAVRDYIRTNWGISSLLSTLSINGALSAIT